MVLGKKVPIFDWEFQPLEKGKKWPSKDTKLEIVLVKHRVPNYILVIFDKYAKKIKCRWWIFLCKYSSPIFIQSKCDSSFKHEFTSRLENSVDPDHLASTHVNV